MITYTIPGARTLDQLTEPTLDGQPDNNTRDNCVPASIAEGLNILRDPSSNTPTFVGDELKDAVYGAGYTGFQAAADYVTYCGDHGVWLAVERSSQMGLIALIHEQVSAGHPVVVTMPSQWGTAPIDPVHPSGYTHVGLAVGVGPDAIRVMNPWHGFMQDATDDWWAARLCEGEVWIMQPAQPLVTTQQQKGNPPVSATTTTGQPGQPTGFYGLVTTSDSQRWHCPATGQDIALGYRWFYAALRGPDNATTATQILGLPISGEYGTADGCVRQDFERGSVIYDAKGAADWQFYMAPLGKELAALHEQVTLLTQSLTQAEADAHQQATQQATAAQTAQTALSQAQAQAALDEGIIADQKQQIAQLQQQLQQLSSSAAAPVSAQPPVVAVASAEVVRAVAQVFAEAFAAGLRAHLDAGAASALPPALPLAAGQDQPLAAASSVVAADRLAG